MKREVLVEIVADTTGLVAAFQRAIDAVEAVFSEEGRRRAERNLAILREMGRDRADQLSRWESEGGAL